MKRLLLWGLMISVLVCSNTLWAQGFKYPIPPDSIRDRQGRINYMAENFWNSETISDTTNFKSPKLLLDYLYLLKQQDNNAKSIKAFISLAAKSENTFGTILYWLDNILYDSSSSHYDESLYLKLMNAVMASDADSVMKLIPAERINILQKNQIGQKANDFSFVDKAGLQYRLFEIEAPLLLLIFNNPDCSLCHQVEEQMASDYVIQRLYKSNSIKILAITPDADYEDWMEHIYPLNWMVGYDRDKVIYSQRLYDIQRLPCMYLLDRDKRVLLKEADYERVHKYLSAESRTITKTSER